MDDYRVQATLGEPLENFVALAKRDPERAAEHIKALEDKLVRALDQQRGAVERIEKLTRERDELAQRLKRASANAEAAEAEVERTRAAYVGAVDTLREIERSCRIAGGEHSSVPFVVAITRRVRAALSDAGGR